MDGIVNIISWACPYYVPAFILDVEDISNDAVLVAGEVNGA